MAVEATPEIIDMEFPHEDSIFKASSFFSSQRCANTLDPMFGRRAIMNGLLPESTVCFVPRLPGIMVDWISPGWFSIYEYAFRIGLKFPCSDLVKDLLVALGVMPSQLMPSAWKLVFAIEAVGAAHNCPITLLDLRNHYTLRTFSKGRYLLRVRANQENLIQDLDKGDDKSWSSSFLFIKKESLGHACDFIPCEFRPDTPLWEESKDSDSESRIKKFLSIPVSERTWPPSIIRTRSAILAGTRVEGSKAVTGCPSFRTRSAFKAIDIMARVKLEGVSVPKRVGKPAEAAVSQGAAPEVQEVDSSSEDETVVKKVPPAKRAEERVEQSSSKKRKIAGSGESPLISFEEGDRLLQNYAKRDREQVDLSQLTVQLVSSISRSLQCALAVGHGYRVSESSHSQSVADKERAEKDIQALKAERDAGQKELKALGSNIKVAQAKVSDLELRLKNRDSEVERLEDLLNKANAQAREVQQEVDSLKGSQQVDAVFFNLCGRIGLLREPVSSHDLYAELLKFKRIFPDDPTFDDLILETGLDIPEREQPEAEPTGEGEAEASEKEGDRCRTPSA